jgi:hypothetical protein
VVLTDGHPGNALVSPAGEVTLIDLEFAEHAAELGAAAFASRCAFDVAYAAAYFTPAERAVFLAAARPRAAPRAEPRIDELGLLFALERRRQRRAA